MLDETVRSTEDTSALKVPPKQTMDDMGKIKVDIFTSVIESNMLNSPQSLSSQSMLTGTRSKNRWNGVEKMYENSTLKLGEV